MKKFKNSRDIATLKAGRTCLNLNWAGSARWRCLSCPASPSSSRRGSTASSATSHSASLPGTLSTATHRRKIKTEEKAKVVAAVWGKEMIQFLAALAILHQDGLKKKINRITATQRNGCFKKCMIIQFTPFQTTTLPKWMFSQKLLSKSSLLQNGQCGIQVIPLTSID